MSDTQDFEGYPAEEGMGGGHVEPQENMAAEQVMPQEKIQSLQEAVTGLDASVNHAYPIGEVPQMHQLDPEVSLPLNSEHIHSISMLVDDANGLVKEEIGQIQKFQKSIDHWESKIEKNKVLIEKNKEVIKKNNTEITYDKKNRDYWWSRAEQVLLDYSIAESSNRTDDWAWLIKKYGLKNPDSTMIDPQHACVEELCNGGANNLAGEYKIAGNKYEQAKKDKEKENNERTRENSRFKDEIEVLQNYVQATYKNNIEPLQDGVLLLKELGAKLKSLPEGANFSELRMWAEGFLDQYLLENPHTRQSVVTDFRRIASIPLPPTNS